jgi:hypothetical protein
VSVKRPLLSVVNFICAPRVGFHVRGISFLHPLHQPSVILKEKRKFEKEEPLSCMCANAKLSQPRGSPHPFVPILCLYNRPKAEDPSCLAR